METSESTYRRRRSGSADAARRQRAGARLCHRDRVARWTRRARRISRGVFDIAVVDLALGDESGLDAIRAIKSRTPDTEIVVISGTPSLASAIASYELKAFAFVPKPFDVDQLFGTVDRALEHRLVVAANRRLVWEQRLVNEIGDELRHLLAPEQLVERVLGRLMRGLGVDASAARLLNPETSEYDLRVDQGARSGAPDLGRGDVADAAPERPGARDPRRRCGSTISTTGSTRKAGGAHPGAVGAERADVRRRRSDRRADRRLPGAGAVHAPGRAAARHHRQPGRGRRAERPAARLRPRRQAGVGGHLRRDRRRDRRLRSPRPSAARQRGARRAPRPPGHRAARPDLRRGRPVRRPVPALRGRPRRRQRLRARRSDPPGRSHLQRHDLSGARRHRRRRDRPDREERDRPRSRTRAGCSR